jgi:hypothetical protein
MGKFDNKGGDDIKTLAVEIQHLYSNLDLLREVILEIDESHKQECDTHNAVYGALWSIIHDLAGKAGLKIDVIAAVEAEWKRDEARGLHLGTYDDPENMPTKDVKGALEDTRGPLE